MDSDQRPGGIGRYWRFTLIELLVVITVIVILAALLLPALSRAKYLARLASCVSNQRQIVVAINLYASENDTRYPHRSIPDATQGFPAPFALKFTDGRLSNGDQSYDIRPELAPYIPLNDLQCPFHPRLDIAGSTVPHVRSNYSYYFGWKLSPGEKQMRKTGDIMTLDGNEFDVLVADTNVVYNGHSSSYFAQASHPDFGVGTMRRGVRDDSVGLWSYYALSGSIQRGPVDLNFCYADGSADTIRRIEVEDTRLKKVDYKYGNNGVGLNLAWSLLPEAE